EILVPILLFAILALIRTRDFNEYHPTCHYASKGFVSAGLMPFLNGWLCFITNRCSLSPITGDEQRNLGEGVQSSLLVDGFRAFADQLEIIGSDPEGFNIAIESLGRVIHALATKNSTLDEWNTTNTLMFRDLFDPSVNVSAELKELGMSDKMAAAVAQAQLTPQFMMEVADEAQKYAGGGSLFGLMTFLETVDLFCKPEKFDSSFLLPSDALPLTAEDRASLCNVFVAEAGTSPLADGLSVARAADKVIPGLGKHVNEMIPALGKFANGPLVKIVRQYFPFNDSAALISAITCGQDIVIQTNQIKENAAASGVKQPSTMNAKMNGDKEGVHTVFDSLRDFILKYVSTAAP
ncbi:hypothetical protein PFISCL1PPCAC_20621, partial [Pristionchus fissidentatus]